MHTRIADAHDLASLLPLCEAYCQSDGHAFDRERVSNALANLLRRPDYGLVITAEHDDALHGYAVLTWGFSLESGGVEALLDELFARPTGRGIGSLLVQAVIDAAARHGARTLFLETETDNESARRFYTRHGFSTESSIWMCRTLHS